MSALVAAILALVGVGGLIAAVETWIRAREARAAEAERHRAHASADAIRAARERSRRVIDGQRDAVIAELELEHRARVSAADDDIEAAERELAERTGRGWR